MAGLNVTTYHQGTGAGTVVLLHGFPVDSRMWDATASLLDASWKVVAIDLPGLGGSAGLLPEPPSMHASARLVHEAIDEFHLDSTPLVIAGLSMGGYVVQAMLKDNSRRVDGVIFLDTRVNADSEEIAANRERIARELLDHQSVEAVLGMSTGTLSEATTQSRPEVVDQMRDMISSQRPEGVAWSQRAMATRPDSTEVVAALTVPVQVIVGRDDAQSPVEVMTELSSLTDKAQLAIIEEAGHMTPVEQPSAVARVINDYLAQFHN